MGENSTDALYRAFHDFLKQCKVVGSDIVTPLDMLAKKDETAGGMKLPHKFDGTTDQGTGSKRDQ